MDPLNATTSSGPMKDLNVEVTSLQYAFSLSKDCSQVCHALMLCDTLRFKSDTYDEKISCSQLPPLPMTFMRNIPGTHRSSPFFTGR